MPNTLAWRIGGPQGTGIDTVTTLFARACAAMQLQLFCRREYHSNIMGRHSFYDVVMASRPVHAHRDHLDMLVALDAETLCRHLSAVSAGGYVVSAADAKPMGLERLVYIESPLQQRLLEALEQADLPATVAGVLELAQRRGVRHIAVDFTGLLQTLSSETGLPVKQLGLMRGTLAVAVSAALLGVPRPRLDQAIAATFNGNADHISTNQRAVALAYRYTEAERFAIEHGLPPSPASTPSPHVFISGSQAVALGKLAAGMGFQAYYPISPATDESRFLEAHPSVALCDGSTGGPLVLQVEDELAALGMACGAALTGARSATATSGPGFSLMSEGLGWAGMNEVPIVISLYQRGGPSTGLPTRTEQGDLLFAVHGGHGEFPRLVIASASVEDCFQDAAQAFDYAERYQLPVIHLLDKALTSTLHTIPVPSLGRRPIDRGLRVEEGANRDVPCERFADTESGVSARALLGQAGGQHWLTGVEHSAVGMVSEDPEQRERMLEKRARKLASALEDIPEHEKLRVYGAAGAAPTFLTWGSSGGAVREALARLADDGIEARAIQLRLLWPFPSDGLLPYLEGAAPLVIVEANHSGQLARLLREQTGHRASHQILKYNGRPMASDALYRAMLGIIDGDAEPRIVLHNPCE